MLFRLFYVSEIDFYNVTGAHNLKKKKPFSLCKLYLFLFTKFHSPKTVDIRHDTCDYYLYAGRKTGSKS